MAVLILLLNHLLIYFYAESRPFWNLNKTIFKMKYFLIL